MFLSTWLLGKARFFLLLSFRRLSFPLNYEAAEHLKIGRQVEGSYNEGGCWQVGGC